MWHDGWRIPDRAFFALSYLVIGLTIGFLIYLYPSLPSPIPTHFGISGEPDAFTPKSIWSVFFPAMMQLLLTLGLSVLYRYPRYSNIPGTMLIDMAPEPVRQQLFRLIRHSLVMTILVMDLIFAYIALAIVSTALGIEARLNVVMMSVLVSLLIIINIVYTLWLYRLAKQARPNPQTPIPPLNASSHDLTN